MISIENMVQTAPTPVAGSGRGSTLPGFGGFSLDDPSPVAPAGIETDASVPNLSSAVGRLPRPIPGLIQSGASVAPVPQDVSAESAKDIPADTGADLPGVVPSPIAPPAERGDPPVAPTERPVRPAANPVLPEVANFGLQTAAARRPETAPPLPPLANDTPRVPGGSTNAAPDRPIERPYGQIFPGGPGVEMRGPADRAPRGAPATPAVEAGVPLARSGAQAKPSDGWLKASGSGTETAPDWGDRLQNPAELAQLARAPAAPITKPTEAMPAAYPRQMTAMGPKPAPIATGPTGTPPPAFPIVPTVQRDMASTGVSQPTADTPSERLPPQGATPVPTTTQSRTSQPNKAPDPVAAQVETRPTATALPAEPLRALPAVPVGPGASYDRPKPAVVTGPLVAPPRAAGKSGALADRAFPAERAEPATPAIRAEPAAPGTGATPAIAATPAIPAQPASPGNRAADSITDIASDPSLPPGSEETISTRSDPSRGIDAPPQRAETARAVQAQIVDAARRLADGSVEVQLSPEDLGRVKLTVSHADGDVAVSILVDRAETLELLRRNADALMADLRNAGFDRLSFSFGQNAPGDDTSGQTGSSDPARDTTDTAPATDDTGTQPPPRLAAPGRLDIRL